MTVRPLRPKGIPLNALRAFEAAARLGGFAIAAEELSVTPGAVAQHIKALEDWAGAPLFERRSQGVRLTALGRETSEQFSKAFDALGSATQNLRILAKPKTIHIAALPSIAQLWLSPLLPEIRATLTDMDISVTALERAPNLRREPFDISLFYSAEPAGPDTTLLMEEEIFPVCAPTLAKEIKDEELCQSTTLLHDSNWSDDWRTWFDAQKMDYSQLSKGPNFSLYSLAVSEAKNGAGLLMGHTPLINRDLQDGLLVPISKKRVKTGRTLTLENAPAFSGTAFHQILLKTLKR